MTHIRPPQSSSPTLRRALTTAAMMLLCWAFMGQGMATPARPTHGHKTHAKLPKLPKLRKNAVKSAKKRVTRRNRHNRRGRSDTGKAHPKTATKVCLPAVVPALTWLRSHMRAAQRAGKPSDLASLLLGGILENAFSQALHSHYALVGLGKALQKGAMERVTVQAMAANMAANLGHGERTFTALGGHAALGQLAATFTALAKLSVAGAGAAAALAKWAGGAEGNALDFDQALERYRVGVARFAAHMGGSGKPTR